MGGGCSISFAHDAGAVALLKHRGKLINTRSDIAITLLSAVYSEVVGQDLSILRLNVANQSFR